LPQFLGAFSQSQVSTHTSKFPLLAPTYDHQATTTKDSTRNSAHKKMKTNKTTRGQEVSNHRRRKDKESESNIDSATHNQNLTK
jgi:hypothetical protein